MYVCVCKAVTDKQIKAAINDGVHSRKQLFQCLGMGGECGKCVKHARQLLDENLPKPSIMQPQSQILATAF